MNNVLASRRLCWRRYTSISLKILLVGVAILSLLLGRSVYIRRAHTLAVERLRQDDAFVYDEFFEPIGPNVLWARSLRARPTAPMYYWQELVGKRFANWSALFTPGWYACELEGERYDSDHLKMLPKLLHLETVRLINITLSPREITILHRIPTLTHLTIIDERLTREALPYLAQLKQVKFMNLELPRIHDDEIRQMATMLPNCQVTY